MKVFRTFGSKVPTSLSKLLSSALMNLLWKNWWMKEVIDVFSRFFAEFCAVLQNVFAGFSKHALYLSTGTFRERLIFLETFFAFDVGENLLADFFVKRLRHVCKNCLLGIEENVSKKNVFQIGYLWYLLYLFQTLNKIVLDS